MICRDLYRCPPEDLHRALAASSSTVLRRGLVEPSSAMEPADVDYLVRHPEFDPSLSFLAYDGGTPVAFLVSQLDARDATEAVWSLFGGAPGASHGLEMLLDEALDHWRREGALRVRQGRTGLLGGEPRLSEDADVVALLKDRGFEIAGESALMTCDLRRLVLPQAVAAQHDQLRQKGYVVRQARPDEIPLIARQYHPRRSALLDLELWNHFVRTVRPEGLLVAESRHQSVGFAACFGPTLESDCPALGPSFVDEVHRGSGLPAVLVHELLGALKQAGKAHATVHCPASRARAYERHGFTTQTRLCAQAVASLA